MPPENDFFRDKFFQEIQNQLKEIKDAQKVQGDDIASIKQKMSWVFGIATGVTFVVNVAWQIVKDRIWKA